MNIGLWCRWSITLSALCFCSALIALQSKAQDGEIVGTPWAGEPGITETVKEIMAREAAAPREAGPLRVRPLRKRGRPIPGPNQITPSQSADLQAAVRTAVAPRLTQTLATNFLAETFAESSDTPPDTDGAPGPTQIMVCLNGRFKLFDKSGNLNNALNVTSDTFFSSVRGSSGTSDPRVKFDRTSNRWFISMINVANNSNRIMLAVSSGPTITDQTSFTFFQFAQDAGTTNTAPDHRGFADYDTLGVDANALYIGVTIFASGTSNTVVGSTVFVVRKSDLLAGTLTVTPFRDISNIQTPYGVDNDNPAATEGYFVGTDQSTLGQIDIRRVSTPGATPTLSGNMSVSIGSSNGALGAVPAQGSTIPIDDIDDRLFQASIHNGTLYSANTLKVDSTGAASGTGDRDAVHWFEINNLTTTPAVRQQGTLFDNAASSPRNYFVASCIGTGQGHMILGCTAAGMSEHLEAAIAGRLSSDALGTLQSAVIAQSSSTTFNLQTSGTVQRWGDYSCTYVDPNDNMTVWTFQEYCPATDQYGVRVIQVKAPPPAMLASCTPNVIAPNASNVIITVTGTSSSGSGFYDPGAGYPNHLQASVSATGMTVNSVTFISPTQFVMNVSTVNTPLGGVAITATNPDGQTTIGSASLLTISQNFTWNGGSGTWAVGTVGWDAGNWSDGNLATFGKGTDTAGTVTITSTVKPLGITFNPPQSGNYTISGGTIDFNANPVVIAVNSSATISSVLANCSALTTNGSGALTLSGASTYSGTTAFNTANVFLNGSLSGGGGTVTVGSGSALRGSGTITRAVVAGSGAVVWPGTSTLGSSVSATEILTVSSLDLSGGGKLKIAANGTNSQQLVVNGGTLCNLSGATLSLGVTSGSYSNKTYMVLNATTNIITSPFATVSVSGAGSVTVKYLNAAGTTITTPSAGTPANRVEVVINGSVTPVRIDGFAARAEGAGVTLAWNAVSEFQNVGFNLYRRVRSPAFRRNGGEQRNAIPPEGGTTNEWARVNPALIAGRITNPDLKSYVIADWPEPGCYEYRLESVSISGKSEFYGTVAGPVVVDRFLSGENGAGDVSIAAAVNSVALANSCARAHTIASAISPFQGLGPNGGNEPRAARLRAGPGLQYFAPLGLTADVLLRKTGAGETPAPRSVADDLVRGSNAGGTPALRGLDSTGSASISTQIAARSASSIAPQWFGAANSAPGIARGNAVKAAYSGNGVLWIPRAKLPAGYDAGHLAIQREARAVTALALTSDGLALYAPGYADDYTDTDAFFFARSASPTLSGTIPKTSGLFGGGIAATTQVAASARLDFHDVYFDFNYRPYDFPPWFSSEYLTAGTAQNFTLNLPDANGAGGTLGVTLWSVALPGGGPHALQAFVNGTPVGAATWMQSDNALTISFTVPAGVFIAGDNAIELVTPDLDGSPPQLSFVNSIAAQYGRDLRAAAPLAFTAAGATRVFEISNLPGAEAWVVDARNPDQERLVAYETQARSDGTFAMRFAAQPGGTGKYFVVPRGQELAASVLEERVLQPVPAGVKWLAVGPAQFEAPLQPLAMARSKEGLRAAFVDQNSIFDYYGFGRYGPSAIQSAVRAARPRYLLLAGRTTYDYRNYGGANVDPLCPAFLVGTTFWSQTTSDALFGDLGRGYSEVAVGRLPANTPDEMAVAVAHTLGHAGASDSGLRALIAADLYDAEAGDFAALSDAVAAALPEIAWNKSYMGVNVPDAPAVTADMLNAANGAADAIAYVGHGNSVRLGATVPRILDVAGIQQWSGDVVFLQSTCTANWVAKDETGFHSIAIQGLVQPQGGLSASIGTNTYLNADAGSAFITRMLAEAQANNARWGDAVMRAQQWAWQQGATQALDASAAGIYFDLSRTEGILGDPALRVSREGSPRPKVAADGKF